MPESKPIHRPENPDSSLYSGSESSVEIFRKIALMLQNTADTEITCGQFTDLIDEYIELGLQGENAAELMPLFKLHLDLCGGCHEEYDALMRIMNRSMEQ